MSTNADDVSIQAVSPLSIFGGAAGAGVVTAGTVACGTSVGDFGAS